MGNSGGSSARSSNRFANVDDVVGVDPKTVSKYVACVSYMQAQCKRRFEDCGERTSTEDPCSASLDRCPDIIFSPGSSWTEESLKSCEEAWKSISCEDIRHNKRPSCSLAKGTRSVGDPCLFPNQCASGNCTKFRTDGSSVSGYPNCSVCGEWVGQGEACNRSGYDCSAEFTCNVTTSKCELRPFLGSPGDPCNDDSTCGGYGISCRADPSDGVKRCMQYPTAGQPCADFHCAEGYSCGTGSVCVAGPGLGQTCGAKGSAQCGPDLVCTGHFDDPPNTCVVPRKLGETCIGDARRAPRGSCEVGLRCDCGEADCDLKSGTCKQSRNAGDDCSDKNSVCVPGTACSDGKCVPLAAQTTLTKLCPPQ
jgi:hypothetical protein